MLSNNRVLEHSISPGPHVLSLWHLSLFFSKSGGLRKEIEGGKLAKRWGRRASGVRVLATAKTARPHVRIRSSPRKKEGEEKEEATTPVKP
jgi:hypothetical protein